MQEKYGPAIAENMLNSIGFPHGKTRAVKNIIGNHHSPSLFEYPELALLKAAEQIVNRDERI